MLHRDEPAVGHTIGPIAPDYERSEQAARATQRFSILGEMTNSIVHDFRNILAIVDAGLRLAERHRNEPEKARIFIEGARGGISSGLQLTSQLLKFGRPGENHAHAANLNLLLSDLEPLLKFGAGSVVDIAFHLSPRIPMCLVDPPQFVAAILNLVINARDAMPSGGQVRISTERCDLSTTPGLKATASYVRVRIADDGAGMPPHVLRKIFEPFFTTKGEQGTGLGVPQVKASMSRIGGEVRVTSEQGRGTIVDLFFRAMAL
jgi:signal transduction histidine kinase